MSNLRRSMMMAGRGGGVLPPGYTQLNYIENDAGKAACFSISQSLGFRVEFEFAPNFRSMNGGYACMFGQNGHFQAAYQNNGKAYIGNAASSGVFFGDGVKANVQCQITNTHTTSYYHVNDVDTGLARASSASTWVFFAATTNGNYPARGKMYSFKMWGLDDTLLMHLLPCRNPSNVCGMYDIVNNIFYGSTSNDQFIGG